MQNERLIRKQRMFCPLCGCDHDVDELVRTAYLTIKGVPVEYEERFMRCANCGDDDSEFADAETEDGNLLNARDAYRRKMGLLTSDEIVEIRRQYGLSQADLSRLLGWGEGTVSRYESKAIQDKAHDNALRKIKLEEA